MKPKGVPALIPFLIAISILFIGILIWAYIETRKANPQMIQVGQASWPAPPRTEAGQEACPT